MSLIGNYSVLHKTPGRFLSGATTSGDRANYNKSGMDRNKFLSMPSFMSVPNGYTPGYAFTPAQTAGGLASYTNLEAVIGTSSSNLAAGINIDASLSAAIVLTQADLSQIVSLLASLSAAINITDAQLAAVAGLQAALSASMSLTNAQLGAIVSLIASLSAQGSFTNANDFATASISASISSTTALSPQSLAAAVWSQAIENGHTAEEIIRLLAAVAAGQTSITDLGGGSATVIFRDLDDTKDRITASMTNSERTSLVLDET
jgi:hypothetical protein